MSDSHRSPETIGVAVDRFHDAVVALYEATPFAPLLRWAVDRLARLLS